jgi:hypothetical protein
LVQIVLVVVLVLVIENQNWQSLIRKAAEYEDENEYEDEPEDPIIWLNLIVSTLDAKLKIK